MKKKIVLCVLFLSMLSACGANESNENHPAADNIKNTEAVIDIDAMEEVPLDLDTYSLNNQDTTYGQPEFVSNRAASSDLGIYYWGGNSDSRERLMFYDKASKTSVLLCNRPNCTHSDNTCNASFNAYTLSGEEFYRYMIYYYEDSVFLAGHDEEHNVNLYKVSPDGSSWETYMTLFKAEMTTVSENGGTSVSWSFPSVCLHRDYVYFIDNSESAPKLRRMWLGGTEAEVVFEPVGERTRLFRMRTYGDFVFFQAGKYVDEKLEAGIYAYNIKTEDVTLVKANAIREYFVVGESLYYEFNEKMYKYDLRTGEDKELPITCLFDSDHVSFVDENGIYVFNEAIGKLEVYDENGNVVGSVEDSQIGRCYFGKDGIFYGQVSGSSQSAILEAEDVLDGQGEWIYIQ